MQPQVTVVIPVHNHAQWVNNAIDSVCRQDYPNKRIVVVDDGSTDGSTEAVLKRLYRPRGPQAQGEPWAALGQIVNFGKTDVMVQRFKESHGPSFARNWGCRVAAEGTDIFGFLDSDDMYLPGKIAKSVAIMSEAPDHIGCVYSDYDTLRPDGLRLRQWKEPFCKLRLLRECIVNCDSLVTKKAFFEAGGFDEQLRVAEDWDLWLRMSERSVLVHIPESLVVVRTGEHSSTSQVAKATWEACYQRVFEKLRERTGQ